MDGSEIIVSMIYIRKDILAVRTYSFITGMSRTPNLIYVLFYIKYHIGNDIYQGHYICDVLD